MPHLRLSVLKTFQATLAGQPIVGFRSTKTQALLAYLLVEADRPHRREKLAGLLWPDLPERAAQHNLSQSLLNLRHLLGDHVAQPALFLTSRHAVQFNPASDYWLDLRALSEHLATAQKHTHAEGDQCAECIQALVQAIDLYQGPFLADFILPNSDLFEEWVLLTREWLQRQVVTALEQLIRYAELHNTCGDSERYARRLVELEPLRETAHRQLMEALAHGGQRSAALAQYDVCCRLLEKELGVGPAEETVALYQQIQRGPLETQTGVPQSAPIHSLSIHSEPQLQVLRSWGDWPSVETFYGRTAESDTLRSWFMVDQCQVIAIVGMGGVGKTTLAATFAESNTTQFDQIIWQSLLNAPPLDEIVRSCLQSLSNHQIHELPTSLNERLTLLLDHLRNRRCLLILDNLESILQTGERAGRFRPSYGAYEQLIMALSQRRHRSCLLLTSREQPLVVSRLVRETSRVRVLPLAGLTTAEGLAILQDQDVNGAAAEYDILVQHYSGNPLALKLVADTIRDLFAGDIAAFLRDETPVFDDIRDVLDQQVARLFPLEQELLTWFAIEREPTAIELLRANLVQPVAQNALLEALHSLQRRSLLEKHADGFTLQNVVLEYVTDRFVTQVIQEMKDESLETYILHPVLKVQAREDVRQSQVRMILQPITDHLVARFGTKGVTALCRRLLKQIRSMGERRRGYAAGNIVNLLLHIGCDLRGYDFSELSIWQADLRGAHLHQANFAKSDLTGSRFTDSFHSINESAFNPDGTLLALCSRSGAVHVMRTVDMQVVSHFSPHAMGVWSVAWSPDSCWLASASEDQTVCIWNIHTRTIRLRLVGHQSWVRSVAWSPDGSLLASASDDHTVRVWDAVSGEVRHILQGHTSRVRAVTFSPDGSLLASASADHTVRLWHVANGEVQYILQGHASRVRAVAFSPDGSLLASASADHTVRLWHVARGDVQHILQGHADWVTALAFHPDGTTLASAGDDQTIRLWNVQSGLIQRVLLGHTSPVVSLSYHPSGTTLASSGSTDHTVRIWDSRTGLTTQRFQGYTQGIRALAFSPDTMTLAHTSYVKEVAIWNIQTRQVVQTLRDQIGWVESLAFSPDGASIASANNDCLVQLWNVRSGTLWRDLRGHTARVTSVVWSPTGRFVASGSQDTTIRLWDVATGATQQVLSGHTDWVKAVAWSPDGTTLASASDDQTVWLWDGATHTRRRILNGHIGGVTSVAFNPTGTLVASGSADHTVRLWDIDRNATVGILSGHTNSVTSVAWSPDGAMLASASADQTIHLWDVDQRTVRTMLQGHRSCVRCIVFSPDGALLASSSDDETIRLWDPHTGTCLDTLSADGPYAGMNIAEATGLTESQRAALKELGAVERYDREEKI